MALKLQKLAEYCSRGLAKRNLWVTWEITCRHLSGRGNDPNEGAKVRPGSLQHRSSYEIIKEQFKSAVAGEPDGGLEIPRSSDFVIIGGGLVGSAVAYFLRTKYVNTKMFDITVVERDPTYSRSSSILSVGGIRHQFSIMENVQMSMFTTEFLRNIRNHLTILDEEPPDVQFNHQGYLFLATKDNAEKLAALVQMQRDLGAEIDLCTVQMLAERFPWLNLEGIEFGSHGVYGEGWFDPWSLLKAFKLKNVSLGVKYAYGDVVGFEKEMVQTPGGSKERLEFVKVKDKDGVINLIRFKDCVNCAGPWAGEIAKMADIGMGDDLDDMSVPLPVEPRKRFVFVVHCPEGPGISAPLTVDTTGLYFRREGLGGNYLVGASPDSEDEEPDISNLEVDYSFFNEKLWPRLAYRIPCFEKLKVKSAWAGYYDYNYIDQNLIIGPHHYHRNMYFANGMSGHGVQQSVAIGNAIAECILEDQYTTIDLSRFGFERFLYDKPVKEDFIV